MEENDEGFARRGRDAAIGGGKVRFELRRDLSCGQGSDFG
jgi:hypothetical protein